jgi:hypothetical protein
MGDISKGLAVQHNLAAKKKKNKYSFTISPAVNPTLLTVKPITDSFFTIPLTASQVLTLSHRPYLAASPYRPLTASQVSTIPLSPLHRFQPYPSHRVTGLPYSSHQVTGFISAFLTALPSFNPPHLTSRVILAFTTKTLLFFQRTTLIFFYFGFLNNKKLFCIGCACTLFPNAVLLK